MKCPECGKNHRPGKALEKCKIKAYSDFGNLILQGFSSSNKIMIDVRNRAEKMSLYYDTIMIIQGAMKSWQK